MASRPTPTLALSPSAAPITPMSASTAASVRNRPHGARRKAQGLVIANPDNSDDEDSASSVRVSPVRSSPVRSSPMAGSPAIHPSIPSSLGRTSNPSLAPVGINSTTSTSALSSQAPQVSGVPPPPASAPISNGHGSAGVNGSPSAPRHLSLSNPPPPYISPPPPLATGNDQRQGPPQPPPQPERHRRAYTSPITEQSPVPSVHLEPARTTSSSLRENPSSPHRGPLPPLPPLRASTAPSHPYTTSTSGPPPPAYPGVASAHVSAPAIVSPPSAASNSSTSLHSIAGHRVASPDDPLLNTSTGNRQRSGSVSKTMLQVTTDNEQFFVVEITGVHTSEGIRERLFSKLRFRDDDYPSLSIFQTDIGEQPDTNALSNQALLQMCQNYGDAKASLKFLVVQTGIPSTTSATVVPPQDPYRHHRPGVPPIVTDMVPPYTPPQGSGSHSNSSSMSGSAADMDRGSGSRTSINSVDDANIARAQVRLGSLSSRSLMTDPPSTIASHHPQALNLPPHPASISQPDLTLGISQDDDEGTYRASRGGAEASSSSAGPSTAESDALAAAAGVNDDMDEATKKLVIGMYLEDQAAEKRARAQRAAREEADKRLAMQEQESEREVWQLMQQIELQNQQDQQQQQQQQQQQPGSHVAISVPRSTDSVPDPPLVTTYHPPPVSASREPSGDDRATQFYRDRAERRDRFANLQGGGAIDAWAAHLVEDNHGAPYNHRRPSEPVRQPTHPPPTHPTRMLTSPATFNSNSPPSYDERHRDQQQQRRMGPPPPGGVRRPSRQQLPYISTNSRSDGGNMYPGLPQPNRMPLTPITAEPGAFNLAPQDRYSAYDGIVPFPSPRPRQSWPIPEPTSPPRHQSVGHADHGSSPGRRPNYNEHDYYRQRSGSDSRVFHDNGHAYEGQYVHRASDGQWVMATRRDDSTFDGGSVAGTTISDSTTIHAPNQDESTVSTVRASDRDEWGRLHNIIDGHGPISSAQTLLQGRQPTTEERDEATLFIHNPREHDWHVRPEPEQLYEHLQEFFPEIDIDAPFVDPAVLSTPSTPSSDSPRNTIDMHRPPPQHPQTRQATASAILNSKPEDLQGKPAQHPIRGAMAAGVQAVTNAAAAAFNKSEYRRSIRNVADLRRRSMQKREADGKPGGPVLALSSNNEVGVRRSSSMWGHRVVEVTPSGIDHQLPPTVPESPSSDGRPVTLNWVKGELIGKGSYGRVYLALNVTTGDMMAVKQVEQLTTREDRIDPRQTSMIEALQGEISLLKDLYHTNIVAYLGCETSPEYLSIFLEYVPGGTIAAIYRTPNQGRFEEQLVKFFTGQILDGLAYLHDKGIWHRDLKGDNILVDANGVCKISDFGISKQTSDVYDSFNNGTMMKGSVFWMAPEVISSQGERSYSGKVDIWSLGCVVIEMWTGSRPWGDLDQMAAIFKLFNRHTPTLPSDIHLSPIAHEFLYERCLANDPSDRPTAVELLQHEFVTARDPSWTFSDSKIGKAVAIRGRARAENTMRSASTGAMT